MFRLWKFIYQTSLWKELSWNESYTCIWPFQSRGTLSDFSNFGVHTISSGWKGFILSRTSYFLFQDLVIEFEAFENFAEDSRNCWSGVVLTRIVTLTTKDYEIISIWAFGPQKETVRLKITFFSLIKTVLLDVHPALVC